MIEIKANWTKRHFSNDITAKDKRDSVTTVNFRPKRCQRREKRLKDILPWVQLLNQRFHGSPSI